MAGDWIKVDCTTPDKPEMVKLAAILGIDQDAAVGKCLRVWIWADQQSANGNALTVTKSFLDRITFCAGFSDALSQVGWLVDEGDKITLPNFDRHNGQTAKTRALTRDRVKSSRSNRYSRNDTSVTPSLPEKRREETNNGDVVIPDKLNTENTKAAALRWFEYLASKGLDDKIPPDGSPQMQAFWDCHSRNFTADEFCEAVTFSMGNGYRTLTKNRTSKKSNETNGHSSSDWLQVQKALSTYPTDWQKRNDMLGPELAEALKRTGTAKVRDANDFELKTLGQLFESHLADVRKEKVVK